MSSLMSNEFMGSGVAGDPRMTSPHHLTLPVEAIDRASVPTHDRGLAVRVAVLETNVHGLKNEVSELKSEFREFRKEMRADISAIRTHDFRLLFGALITVALSLVAVMAKGFHWI
ncbi:hypothetical protein ACFJIX_18415 [Roseateles sp. UC29_93]|uniref:hypothetical protein n=1 Tax=Roseateles sp. UC29_93 TaxID=3350177 RepID=UPI00366E7007